MPKFSILYPYFIIVLCLIICVVGVSSIVRMPVDLFPDISIPVVEVATFYNGMPPEQIENDITGRFERFFTLGSGIEHIESRSLTGVSLIKVFFQPGSNRRFRGHDHLQPGHGRPGAPAAGNPASGRLEIGCVEPSRLSGRPERPGPE